jgi:CheY-like chemotaxis protein
VNQSGKTLPTQAPSGQDADRGVVLPAFQMRVLVIEDNQDLAKLFCDLLEVMGCNTEVALNVRSGLESARKISPDLVFCDLRLPGERDGFDFARELRADEELAHIPLIAVTGYSGVDEQQRALEAGFDRVFAKPIKFAEIQEVLKAYQARR